MSLPSPIHMVARALGQWAAAQKSNPKINPEATLQTLFRRCLTRPPTSAELKKLTRFYDTQLTRFRTVAAVYDRRPHAQPAPGALNPAAFLKSAEPSPEQAAWTALARVLLNLDEAISRE